MIQRMNKYILSWVQQWSLRKLHLKRQRLRLLEEWNYFYLRLESREGADQSALCAIGSVTNGPLGSADGSGMGVLAGIDYLGQSGFELKASFALIFSGFCTVHTWYCNLNVCLHVFRGGGNCCDALVTNSIPWLSSNGFALCISNEKLEKKHFENLPGAVSVWLWTFKVEETEINFLILIRYGKVCPLKNWNQIAAYFKSTNIAGSWQSAHRWPCLLQLTLLSNNSIYLLVSYSSNCSTPSSGVQMLSTRIPLVWVREFKSRSLVSWSNLQYKAKCV